jgi:hypothetical protein
VRFRGTLLSFQGRNVGARSSSENDLVTKQWAREFLEAWGYLARYLVWWLVFAPIYFYVCDVIECTGFIYIPQGAIHNCKGSNGCVNTHPLHNTRSPPRECAGYHFLHIVLKLRILCNWNVRSLKNEKGDQTNGETENGR